MGAAGGFRHLTGCPQARRVPVGNARGNARSEYVVKIRVSSAERDRLDQRAEAWGFAMRARLRELVRAAGTPTEPVEPGVDSLALLLAEIEADGSWLERSGPLGVRSAGQLQLFSLS